jgi:Kdo2-lipid IVA lauroyltransferase/acyltransferase
VSGPPQEGRGGPVPVRARRRPGRWLKNTLLYYLVRGLVGALRRLPLRALLALARPIAALGWLLGRSERRRALDNLAHACPELSHRERRAIARQMFRHLARGALECLALPRLRLDGPASAAAFVSGARAALLDAHAAGRGVIFVTAHLGNWELMAAAVSRLVPVAVLYKPSYDPRFTRMIDAFRARSGVRGIDVSRPAHLRQALQALRRGDVLGVLVDQPVEGGARVPFLGLPAPTTTLPAALARRSGAPIVVGYDQWSGHPCQHAISIERLVVKGSDVEVSEAINARLEEVIRQAPDQWIWSLDRWRSSKIHHLSSSDASYIPVDIV